MTEVNAGPREAALCRVVHSAVCDCAVPAPFPLHAGYQSICARMPTPVISAPSLTPPAISDWFTLSMSRI